MTNSSAYDAARLADKNLIGNGHWYDDYANIAKAARYMADQGDYSVEEIVYLIEKPWKHGDVFLMAQEASNVK